MSKIKAALIIQNCIAGAFENNFESSLTYIQKAHHNGACFIVFPEMNLTGYLSNASIHEISRPIEGNWVDILKKTAVELNITILIGIAEKNQADNIFAAHLIFSPDGTLKKYQKIHTAPFEKKFFLAGSSTDVFESQGLKFGVQLCYDAHFPELSLSMATQNADIIFIPHASPRGTPQEKYDSWIRHLRARAFDNGLYIAACNQIGDNLSGLNFPGISLFIGPDGNIISSSLVNEEDMHFIEIDKSFLKEIRSHKMRYFIPNRRNDLFTF